MDTEEKVAGKDDLADGQMREVQVRDRRVLLVRLDGEFRAYAPQCPHQGAPLADGVLHDGHVRCPWHQAVFDLRNGGLVEPPALDPLPRYETRVEGNDVIVVLPPDATEGARKEEPAGYDADADGRTFGIVGAGAAGLAAAELLRDEGFRGRIVVFTREEHASYDRTQLSKARLANADAPRPTIRANAFFENRGIEILTGHEVTEADVSARTVTCGDGEPLKCDRLLLATGGAPRRLNADGADLANVFTLRSLADGERIRDAAGGASKAVVVGASFIGMEAAAALTQRGLDVTVIAPETVPLKRVFGERIGRMYLQLHEDQGTAFRLGETVARFEGDGVVRRVVLKGGDTIDADLVVVGIGVRPATEYVTGVKTNDDGSLTVDTRLRAGEGVFAAGDIATFPDWRTGEPIRIEHWRLAQQHGRTAARGMLDQDAPCAGVPFFWTSQHKVITDYVGHTREWDDIEFDGDPAKRDFVAYYVRGGKVLAAAGCNREWQMAAIAEVLKPPESPTLDELLQALDGMSAAKGD